STAPGTRRTSMSPRPVPAAVRAAIAPSISRSTRCALKRLATIATRRPRPSRRTAAPRSMPMRILRDFVEKVAEPIALGAQVGGVARVGRQYERLAPGHFEAEAVEADDLARVVGQEPELADADVLEHLGAEAVGPQVGRKPQFLVGFDGVESLILQGV